MAEVLRGGRPKEQVDESHKKRPPAKPKRKRLFEKKQD